MTDKSLLEQCYDLTLDFPDQDIFGDWRESASRSILNFVMMARAPYQKVATEAQKVIDEEYREDIDFRPLQAALDCLSEDVPDEN